MPLGSIALAPIRVDDASSWHSQALRELGKEWSAAAQFAYLAIFEAQAQSEPSVLCTLTWPW